MTRVWRTLRAVDQWFIRINNSWDGSGRVKFGSATSIVVIAITVVGFVGSLLLERQTIDGISTLTLGSWAVMALLLVYTFRTPAKDKDQEQPGVAHE